MATRRVGLCLALLLTSSAFAHEGPRIWLSIEGGEVATWASDDDFNPTVFTRSQLFVGEFEPLTPTVYNTEFPGFQSKPGGLTSGTVVRFDVLEPLRVYDPARARFRPVAARFAGAVPQVAVSNAEDFVVTGPAPVTGFAFFTHGQLGDHEHLGYTLFGNGFSASDGPVGVYALRLRLTSGNSLSKPYTLILGKQVSLGSAEFLAAYDAADVQQARLRGEVTGDRSVSGQDLARLLSQRGRGWATAEGEAADLNANGVVDVTDLAEQASAFGRSV